MTDELGFTPQNCLVPGASGREYPFSVYNISQLDTLLEKGVYVFTRRVIDPGLHSSDQKAHLILEVKANKGGAIGKDEILMSKPNDADFVFYSHTPDPEQMDFIINDIKESDCYAKHVAYIQSEG